jgi:hypothetical protein
MKTADLLLHLLRSGGGTDGECRPDLRRSENMLPLHSLIIFFGSFSSKFYSFSLTSFTKSSRWGMAHSSSSFTLVGSNVQEGRHPLLPMDSDSSYQNFKESAWSLGVAEDCNDGNCNSRKAWTPVPLKRRAMAAFFAIFLLTIVALEVVFKASKRVGFGPTSSNMHYLWTYGPTACECK